MQICVDTNWLILGFREGTVENRQLGQWLNKRYEIYTSLSVWYEYLCGANSEEAAVTKAILGDRILPMDMETAGEAARLFIATGRSRKLRYDSLIAATSVVHEIPLATNNLKDFEKFVPYGLELVKT